MSVAAAPDLTEIEDRAEPGWLWDPARRRILWANAAAIAWFGGETLFDLLDRVFDPGEPAITRLASLAEADVDAAAAPLTPDPITLDFPSLPGHPSLPVRCFRVSLADGRPALLVTGAPVPAIDEKAALRSTALDALPWPVILVAPDGRAIDANREALRLLPEECQAAPGTLFPASALADLLARAAKAGTATLTAPIVTAFGPRELRLTARRLAEQTGDRPDHFAIAIEDVTERRALERALEPARLSRRSSPAPVARPPAANLNETDARTFAHLGERIREVAASAASTAAPPPAAPTTAAPITPTPEPPPPPPAGKPEPAIAAAKPEIPDIVRRTLDLSDSGILLFTAGRLLFANKALTRLLGHAAQADLLARNDIAEAVAGPIGAASTVTLADARGAPLLLDVQLSSFPSTAGPIGKAELRPIADAPEPVVADQPAPPAAAPLAPPIAAQPPVSSPTADELRIILDTATDGIVTLDQAGRILSFSAGAEAIFGHRQAEVHGRPLADLMDAESRKVVRDYLAALGEGGIAAIFNDGREVTAVAAQGGKIPVFLTIGRMGMNGEARLRPESAPAFCAVLRDITQWKKTEAELRRAKDDAEKASAQKSDFLARISHELRTPLNAILGFSEVMRSERFGEIANPKYLGYANDIHTSGEHLLSLINDLLDLSKVEAGKLELNFTSVNLGELAEHCLKIMEEQARGKRVILRRSFPPGLPNVVADLRSMKQILLNLISNAVKFTSAGGQVIVSGQTNSAGEFALRVKDTGIGIAPEALETALQPFGRVHNSAHPEIVGTGLGLPLTKALAEANRAKFEISSKPEKGTSVEIIFPVNRVLAG